MSPVSYRGGPGNKQGSLKDQIPGHSAGLGDCHRGVRLPQRRNWWIGRAKEKCGYSNERTASTRV